MGQRKGTPLPPQGRFASRSGRVPWVPKELKSPPPRLFLLRSCLASRTEGWQGVPGGKHSSGGGARKALSFLALPAF